MGVIAEASIRVRPDTSGFKSEATRGILPSVKSVAGGVLGAFAAVQIGSKIAHGLFLDPIKQAGDFQQSLSVLQATVHGTSAQMSEASKVALKLGADTKLPATSANDAAQAMTELAKGGFSVQKAMTAARGVLELSAAAQIDNATAAQITANALNQFQLAASQSGHVADLLAGAANASSGSVTDMAQSLQFAGTAAHGAHVPITDTVAAISEMANQGLQGSISGSAFAQMLRNLQAPTAKAKDEMDKLNISLYDQQGRLKPLPDVIGQFSQALQGMTDKQKNQALATLFGSRSIQAARIILGQGREAFLKMRDAVDKTGAAQRLAEAQTKGFNGAIQGLQSNIETLQVKLGLKLLPYLSEFVRFLTKIAGASSFTVAIKIVWSGIKSAAGDLIGELRKEIFGSGFKPVRIDSQKVISFEKTKGSIGLFDELKDALVNAPWGQIGQRVGDAISKSIKVSTAAVNKVFDALLAAFQSHQGQIATIGVELIAQIFITLTDPTFWISHWKLALGVALGGLVLFTSGLGEALRGLPLLKFLIGPLTDLGGGIAKGLGVALERVGPALFDVLDRLSPRVANWVQGLILRFGLLETRVPILMVKLAERFASILESLGGRAGALAGRIVVRIVTGLASLAARSGAKVAAMAVVIGATLARAAGSALGQAARIGANIITGIGNKLANVGTSVAHNLSHIQDAIGGIAGAAAGWAAHIGEQIVSGILSGVGGLYDQLKSKLEGALHSVMSTLNPFSPVAHGGQIYIGEPIMQGAIQGILGSVPALSKALSDAVHTSVTAATPGRGGSSTATAGAQLAGATEGGVHFHAPVTISAANPEEFMAKLNRIAIRTA